MKFKLYSALGLNKNSNPSQDEIKKAYKKMAMEYHPDKNKDNPNAEEKFKEISNAYAVLSDDSKKRVYDQVGDDGYNEGDNIIVYDRKNKRVYIYCEAGLRGYLAQRILLQNGYEQVQNLSGGYQLWKAASTELALVS